MDRSLDQFYQVLSPGDVAERVVTKSAFCAARQKLKSSAFIELNHHLVQRWYHDAPVRRWRGFDLRAIGGSALTDDIAVPKDRSEAEMGQGIPATYVPARNTIFLSYAMAWAEVLECSHVFIGVNAIDYSGYPDCRPEYIAAFEQRAGHLL